MDPHCNAAGQELTDEPPSSGCAGLYPDRGPADRAVVEFRRRFYPGVGDDEWSDWRWQLRHRIRDAEFLGRMFELSAQERWAVESRSGNLPFALTPYYAALIDPHDPGDPLRRTVIPDRRETLAVPGEAVDPLSEDEQSPVPGIVHRYPDRVLFLATATCATYCRYCTRSRLVGQEIGVSAAGNWERALGYIAAHPEVRDVLVSGGDPLTLGDGRLAALLGRLREIPHVEIIRIGTKVPVVLPQRITAGLLRTLRAAHPLFVNIHFTHPRELTRECATACQRLADAGIPLGSQTVLLKGVNDDPETMRQLMTGLLKNRVRPYYLYQCDPVTGTSHFRTSVRRGVEIVERLRGFTSGLAVPTYVIDAPGGGGKIPVAPSTVVGREGETLWLRNYLGRACAYPDTAGDGS